MPRHIISNILCNFILNETFIFILFFDLFLLQFCVGVDNTPQKISTDGVIEDDKQSPFG
jgi:hypothetical protein